MTAARQKLEKEHNVIAEKKPFKSIRHQITNHKIRLDIFIARNEKTIKASTHLKWVTPAELEDLPFSSAQGKLRQWVLKNFVQKNGSK